MSNAASFLRLSLLMVCLGCSLAATQSVKAQNEPAAVPAQEVPEGSANPAATAAPPPVTAPQGAATGVSAELQPESAHAAAPQKAAKREKEPPTGIGGLILGYGGIGLGALNLALIPVCSADFYPSGSQDLCVGLSIAYGVIGIGAGIPLAIMGHVRRARYLKWREQHAQTARFLPQLGVLPDPTTPRLTASFRF